MDSQPTVSIDILKRQSRRTISLHITPEGLVEVRAPRLTPLFVIRNFVNTKRDWIDRAREDARKAHTRRRAYREGEAFIIAGKPYVLHITKGNAIVTAGNRIFFPEKFLKTPQKHMETWLRAEAKKILAQRLVHYSGLMGVSYKKLSIRDTTSRWGSCSSTGTLSFSYRLILADLPVVDYVVVHELAHITHHNHKREFWDLVGEFFPDYRVRRAWLRNKGHELKI